MISFRAPWQKDLRGILPHAFKVNWVYGNCRSGAGRALFNNSGSASTTIIGGWQFQGAARIQSGNLLDLGNVVLVGMTDQEFADSVGVWFDDANKIAYYLPKDFLDQSYKAYQYDVGRIHFRTGAPTGRYVAPAGSAGAGNCIQLVPAIAHRGTTISAGRCS